MTPDEHFVLKLNDFVDARVSLDRNLDVVVEFRQLGGTEPMSLASLRLEDLHRVVKFATFHAVGGRE